MTLVQSMLSTLLFSQLYDRELRNPQAFSILSQLDLVLDRQPVIPHIASQMQRPGSRLLCRDRKGRFVTIEPYLQIRMIRIASVAQLLGWSLQRYAVAHVVVGFTSCWPLAWRFTSCWPLAWRFTFEADLLRADMVYSIPSRLEQRVAMICRRGE